MNREKETASYKVIADSGGNSYRFYCELSGLSISTTHPIHAKTTQEELNVAWETVGRAHFNKCPQCGKWVSNLMFNVETSQLGDTLPWNSRAIWLWHKGNGKN